MNPYQKYEVKSTLVWLFNIPQTCARGFKPLTSHIFISLEEYILNVRKRTAELSKYHSFPSIFVTKFQDVQTSFLVNSKSCVSHVERRNETWQKESVTK